MAGDVPASTSATVIWLVLSVLVLVGGVALIDNLPDAYLGDFLCFWSAGYLTAHGESPYDADGLRETQRWLRGKLLENSWQDYDSYWYPPWFSLLLAAFVPLGYPLARIAWVVFNAELLVLTAYLLRPLLRHAPGGVAFVVVPLFVFSQWALMLSGQTSILVLCPLVAAWRLLERRHDGAAGLLLAWLTVKPQIAAVLLFGVLGWAVRWGRWRAVVGFIAGMALLLGVSVAVQPHWLERLLRSLADSPRPTDIDPGFGATWLLVLKVMDLTGRDLMAAYAVLALPVLAGLLWTVWRRPLREVVALSCLAVFFVTPYSQPYDFPVLVVPLLFVLDEQTSSPRVMFVLTAFVVLPYFHLDLHLGFLNLRPEPLEPHYKYLFMWVPALLLLLWLEQALRGFSQRLASGGSHAPGDFKEPGA